MVVKKALTPSPSQRYGSARTFQADLQAFLEQRPTAAERERRGGQTIEAARAMLRKATQTIRRARRHVQVAGAVGWFGAGMLLWIGGSYGWQALQARPVVDPPRAPAGPVPLSMLYRVEGEKRLRAGDWRQAEVLLQRAVELGNTDGATLAALALAHADGVTPLRVEPVRVEPVKAKAKVVKKTRRAARARRWR